MNKRQTIIDNDVLRKEFETEFEKKQLQSVESLKNNVALYDCLFTAFCHGLINNKKIIEVKPNVFVKYEK